jgi:hypothetical protein
VVRHIDSGDAPGHGNDAGPLADFPGGGVSVPMAAR